MTVRWFAIFEAIAVDRPHVNEQIGQAFDRVIPILEQARKHDEAGDLDHVVLTMALSLDGINNVPGLESMDVEDQVRHQLVKFVIAGEWVSLVLHTKYRDTASDGILETAVLLNRWVRGVVANARAHPDFEQED